MKNLILVLAISLFFASCTEVYFEQSQPESINSRPYFPKEMKGDFIDKSKKDTLRITDKSYTLGNESSVYNVNGELSENTVLKYYGGYYFLSTKNPEGWGVVAIKVKNKSLTVFTIDGEDTKIVQKIKAITEVKEVFKEDEIDYYIINPSKEVLLKLMKAKIFSKEGSFKRLN